MKIMARHLAVCAFVAALWCGNAAPAKAAGPVVLAPHRAIYDLRLLRAPGKRSIVAVHGRILYDFAGNACDGYTLQFRQVSELDSGEGSVSLSDLQATTWEDGQSKHYRFNSENKLDQRVVDAVEGNAERDADKVDVNLAKPQHKSFALDAPIVFPTEHMMRILAAAEAGQSILEFPVFDGSETGDKVYNTMTIIGHERTAAEETKSDDAVAKQPSLAELKRWPVTISYFDRGKTEGEQTPVYSISFELLENGISRSLSLDYGDFVVAGDMTQLDLKETKPCQ